MTQKSKSKNDSSGKQTKSTKKAKSSAENQDIDDEELKTVKQIDSRIFDQVFPEVPKYSIKAGVEVCEEYKPKTIIAVGGGSTIDTAKMIFLMYEQPNINPNTMMAPSFLGLRKKVLLFVAIPTTSGTGSEATFVSVVTDTDRDPPKKTSVVLYELCPDFVVW